ncbi:hypothetical protein ACLOJK_018578 [Asimina triloba]
MLGRRRCACCHRWQLDLPLEASSVLELGHRRTATAYGRDVVAEFNRGGGDGCVGSIGRLLPLLDGVGGSDGAGCRHAQTASEKTLWSPVSIAVGEDGVGCGRRI